MLIYILVIIFVYANIEQSVYEKYYNQSVGIFLPELMYTSIEELGISPNEYMVLINSRQSRDQMFQELYAGKDYIYQCYVLYNFSYNFCSNPVFVRTYFSTLPQHRLREEMTYNNLYSILYGIRIVELKDTRIDPETGEEYIVYRYIIDDSGSANCAILWTFLPIFPTGILTYIISNYAMNEILNNIQPDTCRVASDYYARILSHLSNILENHRQALAYHTSVLNQTYDQFYRNAGCDYYPKLCINALEYLNRSKELLELYNTLPDRMLKSHSVFVIRSSYLVEDISTINSKMIELMSEINLENQKLLENISNMQLSKNCIDEELLYIDYKFKEGSPKQDCEYALQLINIYNPDQIPNQLFRMNRYLKDLLNYIDKYNHLNRIAYDKAKIAIDMVRNRRLDELARSNLNQELKRSLREMILQDRKTMGKTYLFLVNFRFEDYYGNWNNLYTRINRLLDLAEKDGLDVYIERRMFETIQNYNDSESLYFIEQSVRYKAVNAYSYLNDQRNRILDLISRLPGSVAVQYRIELQRIEQGEGLDIEQNIGRLKQISNDYINLLSRLESEVQVYLKENLDIEFNLIYPERFYVDSPSRSYLLVRVCNPFDVEIRDINIRPNQLMRDYEMNIKINTLQPMTCEHFESSKEEIFATSNIILNEAILKDNVLYTKDILVITSRLNGNAVYNLKEYRVKVGENRFEVINTVPVPLYIRELVDNNTRIVELEWKYGNYSSIRVEYMNLSPCGRRGNVFRFCNTSIDYIIPKYEQVLNMSLNGSNYSEISDHINRKIEEIMNQRFVEYLNTTYGNLINNTNLSINYTNSSQILILADKSVEDYAKKIYNNLKSILRSSEGNAYLSYLYQKVLAGNLSALQEMERLNERSKNVSINTSIIDRYEMDYVKEYFDLDPKRVRDELGRIYEMMIYDEQRAQERLRELESKIISQYEIAKARIRLLLDKYSAEDVAKIDNMLEQNRIKDAINYMKNSKPIVVRSTNVQQQQDLRPYALVFLLILIGILSYHIIKKRGSQRYRILDEEDKE